MTILGANRNGETLPPAHEPDERGVAMRGIQAIWTICREPRLLLGVLSVALLLVLVALWVPQMPSQLQSNPAAANRWLLDISRELGRGGDILRALGIFNLLSSPLFRTLLLTAAFLLAIQVADQLGVLLALRQLPAALQEPVKQAGDPLVLPPALVPGVGELLVDTSRDDDALPGTRFDPSQPFTLAARSLALIRFSRRNPSARAA